MNRRFEFFSALFVAAAACGPSGSNPDGGAGFDAGPCPGGGSPANQVQNASFECGGAAPTEWYAQYGTFAVVSDTPHSGTQAGKLTAPSTGQGSLLYSPDVVKDPGSKTYCATAWMRGTTHDAQLIVRTVDATGSGGLDLTFSSPITNAWVRLPPSTALKIVGNGDSRYLLKVVTKNGKPGDVLYVDDVDVWESANGRCEESR